MAQTFISKQHNGNWAARTQFELEAPRWLTIRTTKDSRGRLSTWASVCTLKDGFETHVIYEDYSKVIKTTSPSRVTSKAVEAQHDEVLNTIEALKLDVANFYAAKVKSC